MLENGLPPQNIEAEVALLGSCIMEAACVGEVLETVSSAYFYRPAHALIWDTLVAMREAQAPIDIVSLKAALAAKHALESVGGHEYLMALIESVPTSANALHYAKLIKEMAIRREVIAIGGELFRRGADSTMPVEELLDVAEKRVFELIRAQVRSAQCVPVSEVVPPSIDRIASIRDRGNATHLWGLSFGFRDIDNMTCGMQPGQLIIIAGRPSIGKSSLALNIIDKLTVDQKKPVAFFSMEMSKELITENMICTRAGVNTMEMRRGYVSDSDFQRIALAAGQLSEAPLYIDDAAGLSALELRARARRYHVEHKIVLIVIDHVQMLTMKMNIESRNQDLGMVSLALKSLARELKVPVIVISQLSRATELRGDKRPRLSDLRDTGSLEQDADLVLLLYRAGYYTRDENDKTCEIDIAKQRCGPTGRVDLIFNEKYTKFLDASFKSADDSPV